jgi:hypothetical protein
MCFGSSEGEGECNLLSLAATRFWDRGVQHAKGRLFGSGLPSGLLRGRALGEVGKRLVGVRWALLVCIGTRLYVCV